MLIPSSRVNFKPPARRSLAKDLAPAVGGFALGLPAGVLGVEIAPQVTRSLLKAGERFVLKNPQHLQLAAKVAPYLYDRSFMASACGITCGFACFALGAAVTYAALRD